MGRFGGFEVDVEAYFIFIDVEAYHSPVRQEVRCFSYGENRHAAQAPEDCGLAPGLITAKEEDVATLDFLWLAYQVDAEYPGSDRLALDGALEFLAPRLIVEYAEFE